MTEITKLSITEIFEILPEVQLSKLPELITEIVEHIDEFGYGYTPEYGALQQWNLSVRLLYYCNVNHSHLSKETLEKMWLIVKAYDFIISQPNKDTP